MDQEGAVTLIELVRQDVIRIKARVKDRQEAIRCAGQVLFENNVVEERYIDAMIRTCDQLGPYIVLAPGVAIPHARPEDGVHRVGMSVITLEDPIEFGNPENDPVHLVIGFACVDNESHVGVLSQLSTFLLDQDKVDAMQRVETKEEAIRLLLDEA